MAHHMCMNSYEEFFNELMGDPEVRKEYEALEPEFQLMRALVRNGREAGTSRKGGDGEKTGMRRPHAGVTQDL